MKRAALAFICVAVSAPLFAQRTRAVAPPAAPPAAGEPLAGITAERRALFVAAKREFNFLFEVQDGLGPMFNDRGCTMCHVDPADGGGSFKTVVRIGKMIDGKFDPLAQFGGSLLQKGMGPNEGSSHLFPSDSFIRTVDVIETRRRTQPVFGLGLVEATPDSTFIALAQSESASGTPGRVAMVDNRLAGMKTAGKFGWKAQIATLQEFAAVALADEIGITNPLFPNETCPAGNCSELAFNPRPDLNDDGTRVRLDTVFMQLLAPPPRGPITAEAVAGEQVFNQIGCNSCHVSTLQTGPNSDRVFDRVTYHPYSDFLLHDMGNLGDGIEQGDAKGREMRTQPLWGLRFAFATRLAPTLLERGDFLHHGEAKGLDEAILGHAGQAATARQRFVELNDTDHANLMAFLKSL